MSIRKNILVLGNFGYANHDLSGQTIKTRAMRMLFEKYGDDYSIDYFDTQTFAKKGNIVRMFHKVSKCNVLIYLPAHNNLKYIFPLLYICSLVFRFDIIYSVIGGWLVHFLKNIPLHRRMLKNIKCILAETSTTKYGLEEKYNFKNVDVLYNFRLTEFVLPPFSCHDNLRLVFMARIDPKKGLDTIFNFCNYLRETKNPHKLSIDFFGPIDPAIYEAFNNAIESYEFVNYKGCLEPVNIYEAIKDYDLLLLPTHYYTEGLPGSIIEAYISGLPVIVTEWEHSHEFVIEGETGIIIPFENNQDEFNNVIVELAKHPEKIVRMKSLVQKFSQRFTGDYAWNKVQKYI